MSIKSENISKEEFSSLFIIMKTGKPGAANSEAGQFNKLHFFARGERAEPAKPVIHSEILRILLNYEGLRSFN